ncbi:GrpE protein [Catenulispora acidiphila DSM 44928]|uniref:Protein GrpE n=1 Tax=Catenulispora acidiphila (strain DSM 44928 / JCM 14897 / NBRC 102108 / NRRL B-24433 / ID139908) TaxID=479433 RepID=C7PWK0_CATAD|nr:nucleotide exchange factor GrpE [Catenulispora acidiphila]ACU75280.1 GrpE protein [Catenulispora acidiphila DSM 44928]
MADENGALGRDAPPTGAETRAEAPADSASTPENLTERAPRESTERPSGPDAPATAELEDRWRRALADLDNARKRHARELSQAAAAERRRVCLAWLPVVDHLELALDHADGDSPFVAGVRAVRDQAVGVLASLGFARDDQTGVPFDPQRHEATGVVEDPGSPPGTVVRVLRPGYGRPPESQLRPAAVLVSAKSAGQG